MRVVVANDDPGSASPWPNTFRFSALQRNRFAGGRGRLWDRLRRSPRLPRARATRSATPVVLPPIPWSRPRPCSVASVCHRAAFRIL